MGKLLAVLFDLDGVLVDSYEAWFQLVNLAARTFRQADIEPERFQNCWGQGIEVDLDEFFPGCSVQQIQKFYEQHLLDFDSGIQVNPEAHETLKALRQEQIPLSVITNTPTTLARDILALTGLIGMVDVTVGASPDVQPKPAPDSILLACETLSVKPSDAMVVGDSRFDEAAAKAAHAHFVGYRMDKTHSISNLSEVLELVATHEHN